MPKAQKSSASSGTRKKHARKAAGSEQQLPLPKEKKPKDKTKGRNKEPRPKVYIPPTKPAAVKPDPLDSHGIAKKLPPELVIVLRRLGKKDTVTKTKALDELQSAWISRAGVAEADYSTVNALQLSLPVLLHHLPSLLLHYSRRIRLQAIELLTTYLRLPDIANKLVLFIRGGGSASEIEHLVGSWCMATQDVDRQVGLSARKAWDSFFLPWAKTPAPQEWDDTMQPLDETVIQPLFEFVKRSAYDPQGLYLELNPVQPTYVPPIHGQKAKLQRLQFQEPKQDDDTNSRSKPEDDEEGEEDRQARIRTGALGVMKWILDTAPEAGSDILPSSLVFWTCLFHGASPPFIEDNVSFGFSQPVVRKAAWGILGSLIKSHTGVVESNLPLLSPAVLRSAWVEPDATVRASMWDPLLQFIKRFPSAWLQSGTPPSDTKIDEDSDEDSEDEETEDTKDPIQTGLPVGQASGAREGGSEAFREFLQFLELGCHGSPAPGYPVIVIILSTIPPSILGNEPEAWSIFCTSFWAALDGRALSSLDRVQSSTAFLNSLLECCVFLIKRASSAEIQDGTVHFVEEQTSRVWTELRSKKLRVDANEAGKSLCRLLSSLDVIDSHLSEAAWKPIVEAIRRSFDDSSTSEEDIEHQLELLLGIKSASKDTKLLSTIRFEQLIHDITKSTLDNGSDTSTPSIAQSRLTSIIAVAGDVVFDSLSDGLKQQLDGFMLSDSTAMSSKLRQVYLQKRGDEGVCSSLWRNCLLAIASSNDPEGKQLLSDLLDASEKGVLPAHLKPEDGELDQYASRLVADAVSAEDSDFMSLAGRLLSKPGHFLSARAIGGLVHSIAFAFAENARALLREEDKSAVGALQAPLRLLSGCIVSQPNIVSYEGLREFLPDIFSFAYLFDGSEGSADAKKIWTSFESQAIGEQRHDIVSSIKAMLRDLIGDTDICIPPSSIVALAFNSPPGIVIDVLPDLFPPQAELDDMLRDLPSDPPDYSLAIMDRLIPPSSLWKLEHERLEIFDSAGFSEYARIVSSLLTLAITDRGLARKEMWLLPHFIVLCIAAEDALMVPSDDLVLFGRHVSQSDLKDIVTKVETLSALLLLDSGDDSWHSSVTKSIIQNKRVVVDPLGTFLFDMITSAQQNDSVREGRVVHFIVKHILSAATISDADQWCLLARHIEKKAPLTSVGIVFAVTESGLEPPRLDRYRNELAAGILSISAAKADSEGLLLLYRLAATAPSLESDVVFLPQARAVNFMKRCQEWVTSDEEIDEDVECEMLVVFQYLAPILQNMPGAHWDLIFEMIENNLETSSFSDPSTLTLLTRTFRLIQDIQALVTSNKSLKAVWAERERTILALARDLVQNAQAPTQISKPRAICWDLALTIVQDLPSSLINEETLSKMVHILGDPDVSILRMVYPLLQVAAKKRTEHVVIEAGVDTSEDAKFELPNELLQLIQTLLDVADDTHVFGYLLGWMVVFDLFDGASLRVKMSYAGQLRDLDIISKNFLPTIFELLGLYGGKIKPSPLDIWAVQEYYVQLYDEDVEFSPNLLAAHLYYRALLNVPSLVASWWGDCKDRQLSMAVASMTARHFSPVLIFAELKHVKDPEGSAELSGENWTIKVSNAVHEVSAAFMVDEESMEIAIKLPADYPLHSVEVKDIRRLGVEEKRWRGWLLAVQQVVTSQNGRIVDGLSIFKRNVTNHFENQTECAICYSIVSATELSLPKKRCRTCKNRFHAGCLYKWFNTSHTSSCPLCRSDFI